MTFAEFHALICSQLTQLLNTAHAAGEEWQQRAQVAEARVAELEAKLAEPNGAPRSAGTTMAANAGDLA